MLSNTLVVALTSDLYLDTRVKSIQNTWGKLIDTIFLTDSENSQKDIIGYNTPKNYDGIQDKYLNFFEKFNFEKYDYYFFVDDDTFINIENLKSLKIPSSEDNFAYIRRLVLNPDGTDKDGNYTGYPMDKLRGHNIQLPLTHPSGGAGYILSKKTTLEIKKYLEFAKDDTSLSGHSDVTLGFWLRNVGSNLIFSEDLWWEKPKECEPFGFNEKTFLTLHYVDEELMYKYNKKYNLNE